MNKLNRVSPGETAGPSNYSAGAVIQHFDDFGIQEWERLVQSPSDEASLYVHTHYLEKYIRTGMRVLEIGAGAGRFTQVLAGLGAQVLVADISSVELDLNRRFASQLGFQEAVLDWQQVDICDLSAFEPDSFECVLAYGGPFSYVLDQRDLALSQCLRVLQAGGLLLLSVMSLWGSAHGRLDGVLTLPASINQKVTSTGDITPATLPGRKNNFMHLFRSSELKVWLDAQNLEILELSASNCISLTWNEMLKEIRKDAAKWKELLRMEVEACAEPGCLDMGLHLIAVARKQEKEL